MGAKLVQVEVLWLQFVKRLLVWAAVGWIAVAVKLGLSLGPLGCYISRVERGYTAPSLSTLAKFAKALNVEHYQFLFEKQGQPRSAALPNRPALSRSASRLLRLYEGMPASDRKLLVLVATKIAKS
jgi:transcriptional regulator with XRE-family HTH domain